MAGLTPLPPTVHHSTTRLTHLQAHTLLSNFLTTAENEAAYRPDSTLSERGPISASTSGSGGLTLGNLKRILKGLEGKRVGGAHLKTDLDESVAGAGKKRRRNDTDRDDDDAAAKRRRQDEEYFEVEIEEGDAVVRAEENASEGSGWQDQAAYELEQDDENLDAMNEEHDPGANVEQPENEGEEQEMMAVEVEGTGAKEKSKQDKDKRKEEKKARLKKDKAQRAREREEKSKKNGRGGEVV